MKRFLIASALLAAACGNTVVIDDGGGGSASVAPDPCAEHDEKDCAGECRGVYEGVSCEGSQDYLGCVSKSVFECKGSADCFSGEECRPITSPLCPVVPGFASCLACGSRDLHVCIP